MRRPVMTEKHAADRRQVSLKTQRRRRSMARGRPGGGTRSRGRGPNPRWLGENGQKKPTESGWFFE